MNKDTSVRLLLGQREPSLTDDRGIVEVAKKAGFTDSEIEELKRLYPEEAKKERKT